MLQNNGSEAHQVVQHVHFHIIPRLGSAGLEIGWRPERLEDRRAEELVARMREALAEDWAGPGEP